MLTEGIEEEEEELTEKTSLLCRDHGVQIRISQPSQDVAGLCFCISFMTIECF